MHIRTHASTCLRATRTAHTRHPHTHQHKKTARRLAQVRLWNWDGSYLRLASALPGGGGVCVRAVAPASRDGRLLLAASSTQLRLWDSATAAAGQQQAALRAMGPGNNGTSKVVNLVYAAVALGMV